MSTGSNFKVDQELHLLTERDSPQQKNVHFFRSLEKTHEDLLDHVYGLGLVLDVFSKTLDIDGPIVEIGTRLGGSAICFMEVLCYYGKKKQIITVDPYGSLPFETCENLNPCVNSEYDEDMYRRAIYEMSKFAYENCMDHMHFKATSTYFMKQYDKLETFDEGKAVPVKNPSFVYLDGSHKYKIAEANFFFNKLQKGGFIVIDDTELLQPKIDKAFGNRGNVFHIPGNRSIVTHRETKEFLNNIVAFKVM
jgi:predicted O-methyltransferase YrrM